MYQNLFEASKAGQLMKFSIDLDGDLITRFASDVFKADVGLVFADAGWCTNDSSHPFHIIEGQVHGDSPWTCGNARIEAIERGMPDASILDVWELHKKEHPYSTRENVLKLIREDFTDIEIYD